MPSAIHKAYLSRHTGTVWSGGGGGSGTRGRTGSDGAEQRPPGRPLLRLPRVDASDGEGHEQMRDASAAQDDGASMSEGE